MKKFLSASDIAKLEHVSNMTATRWVRKGIFPNARKVGKSFRVPLSDYHKWRESTKVNPDSPEPQQQETFERSNERTLDLKPAKHG